MSKKGNNLVRLVALGAAIAGTYYYLKKKNSDIPANMDDDEDFDNFDEDVDDGPVAKTSGKRNYTSLNFNDIESKVKDTAVKFADAADKASSTVSEKLQGAAEKVEEFFDDRKTTINVTPEEVEANAPCDEASEDDYEEHSVE